MSLFSFLNVWYEPPFSFSFFSFLHIMKAGFVHLALISVDWLLTALACKRFLAGIVHRQKSVIPPGDKILERKAVILHS